MALPRHLAETTRHALRLPPMDRLPALFEVLDRFHRTLSDPALETSSTNMQAIQLRKALEVSELTHSGLPHTFTAPKKSDHYLVFKKGAIHSSVQNRSLKQM